MYNRDSVISGHVSLVRQFILLSILAFRRSLLSAMKKLTILRVHSTCYSAPVTLYWIVSEQSDFYIALMFKLLHCNMIFATKQKLLHFVGDTKNNLVCAVPKAAYSHGLSPLYTALKYLNWSFSARMCFA